MLCWQGWPLPRSVWPMLKRVRRLPKPIDPPCIAARRTQKTHRPTLNCCPTATKTHRPTLRLQVEVKFSQNPLSKVTTSFGNNGFLQNDRFWVFFKVGQKVGFAIMGCFRSGSKNGFHNQRVTRKWVCKLVGATNVAVWCPLSTHHVHCIFPWVGIQSVSMCTRLHINQMPDAPKGHPPMRNESLYTHVFWHDWKKPLLFPCAFHTLQLEAISF